MIEVPLSNSSDVAVIDDVDGSKVLAHRWRKLGGYAITTINRTTVQMHQLVRETDSQVDHRNGQTLDNTRENLRPSAQTQNMGNRRKSKGKSSQYKGVSWNKAHGKWQAHIMRNNKSFNLGEFTDEREAAKSYDRAAREYFGEFARPNFNNQETSWAI
jgi:hypothetical protein